MSPNELQTYSDILVLICSPQHSVVQAVGQQLDMMKVEWCGIDEMIFKLYGDEIMNCYDLLDDQLSKDTYAHIIYCRMTNTMPETQYVVGNQYFWLEQLDLLSNETFIDCGAYTGDTVETYIRKKNGVFKKIVAYEPDKQNFAAMQCRVSKLKKEWKLGEESIELFCCGVGESNCRQSFQTNGTVGSACLDKNEVTNGNVENIDVISLDYAYKDSYDFLKADIEGYEYNMLLGAQKVYLEINQF